MNKVTITVYGQEDVIRDFHILSINLTEVQGREKKIRISLDRTHESGGIIVRADGPIDIRPCTSNAVIITLAKE